MASCNFLFDNAIKQAFKWTVNWLNTADRWRGVSRNAADSVAVFEWPWCSCVMPLLPLEITARCSHWTFPIFQCLQIRHHWPLRRSTQQIHLHWWKLTTTFSCVGHGRPGCPGFILRLKWKLLTDGTLTTDSSPKVPIYPKVNQSLKCLLSQSQFAAVFVDSVTHSTTLQNVTNVRKRLGVEFRFLPAQNFHGECITWLDDCSIFWNMRRTCIEEANGFLVFVDAFKEFIFYDCKATFLLRFPKTLDISVLWSLCTPFFLTGTLLR